MDKIYLVRYGCYSDQGIAGAFSTEEKAKRYCEVHNEINGEYADPYWVDEIIVDLYEVNPNAKVVTYYTAIIALKDERNPDKLQFWTKKGEIMDTYADKDFYSKNTIVNITEDYIEVKSITSEEHAKKVAIEQYQIYTQQELEDGKI